MGSDVMDYMPMMGPDAIVHLAGETKPLDNIPAEQYVSGNVDTTRRLAELFPDVPLILASTTAVYDEQGKVNPKHPYAVSKLAAERYATVAMRMGTIIGSNGHGRFRNVTDLMIDNAISQGVINVVYPDDVRAIVGLEAVCIAYCRRANRLLIGKTRSAHVDLAQCVMTIGEIAELVQKYCGIMGMTATTKTFDDIQDAPLKYKLSKDRHQSIPPGLVNEVESRANNAMKHITVLKALHDYLTTMEAI